MKTIHIDKPLLKSLLVLATVIEARDPFTGGHVWRTGQYARLLAEKLGMGLGDTFLAHLGGLVHDLGKVGIPDTILKKRERISEEEYEIVKHHPSIGGSIVENHPLGSLVESAVTQHHVRMDGEGYPAGISPEHLSGVGKVISIADAFDAMTSFRPYRGRGDLDRALGILEDEKGKQFEASFVDPFVALGRAGKLDHVLGHCSEARMMLECPDCGPIIAPPKAARDSHLIACPGCTSSFVLHVSGDTFELEWTGSKTNAYVPKPDMDAVEAFLELPLPK